MNYYTTNSDSIEESAKAICTLLIGIITLIAWGYGVYHFGVEAYASDWEIGKVAILALCWRSLLNHTSFMWFGLACVSAFYQEVVRDICMKITNSSNAVGGFVFFQRYSRGVNK